jgi:hypothetical protein
MSHKKDRLFQEGNRFVTAGNYIAAARAFRAAAETGHSLSPVDCSILFDAMLEGSREAARSLFRREADSGNSMAACCHFLSWLYYDSEGDVSSFDPVYAFKALRQAENLKSAHAEEAAADFFVNTVQTSGFTAFVKKIKEAACSSAEAMRILGDMFSCGVSVPENHKKAVEYYRKAAEKGSVKAVFRLGMHYLYGEGTGQDTKMAFKLICSAAENGLTEAITETGRIILNDVDVLHKDRKEAVPYIVKASRLGDMEARRIHGKMLFYGRLLEQDKEKGLEMLEEAHFSGNTQASLDSGLAYYYHGMLQQAANLKCAMDRFSVAAENGSGEAWKMIGRMFFRGETGEGRTGRGRRDEAHARDCFEEAVRRGCMLARYDLAELFYERAGELDFRKAYELFLQLAYAGHAQSQYRAALMLRDGYGTEQNYEKAYYWLTKAAEQGYGEASYQLFEFALRELPRKEKPEQVLSLLLKALYEGSRSALLFIRNGRKADHLPVMFKEQFFENFLFNMKEALISGKRKESFPFFLFALENSEILVPVINTEKSVKKAINKTGQMDRLLAELGTSVLGTGRESCSAVLAKIPAWKIEKDDIGITGEAEKDYIAPDKNAHIHIYDKQNTDKRVKAEIFPFFSRREEIPLTWLKKYRFIPLPAKRCLDIFWKFRLEHNFPAGLVLDPFSGMLALRQAYSFLIEIPADLKKYFREPEPEEEIW